VFFFIFFERLKGQKDMDHLKVNELRWKLMEYLVTTFQFVLVPLFPFNFKDESKRGKVPCLKWKGLINTTRKDLREWQRWYDGFCNVGLVMGVKSGGILGIDVDGAGGREILKEISGGDIPRTVSYNTPGGDGKGRRYLYWPPDEFKGQTFKKAIWTGEGEHCGVELLVDGQQSVLPYSIHPNGGVYEFRKGRSFEEVDIAVAPAWLMDILLKKQKQTITSPKVIVENKVPTSASAVSNLSVEALLANADCRRLHELLEEQKSPTSLDEPTWFNCVAFLTAAGFPEAAIEFSALSHKHQKRSEDRIDELEHQESKGTVRCSTFGCSEDQISLCFQKLHYNDSGDITNSPAVKLCPERRDNGDIGIEYNKEGHFMRVNPQKFLKAFIKRTDLRIFPGHRGEDSRYYIYQDANFWQEASPLDLKRLMQDLLDSHEPDRWTSSLMKECLNLLPLECRRPMDLTNSAGYINVINGLIDLNTLTLKPHDKEIFCTTQIPLLYDEKAEYPAFQAFLGDVFLEDREIIQLTQELFGYALSPSLDAQMFFVWVGDGANAKSVLAKVLSQLVGKQNISRVSLRKFGERFGLASIVDKRLIIATENEMSSRPLDSEMLKAITAGDPVTIERKFADIFEYQPTVKMIFLTNRPPRFSDLSFALRRRMVVIPFEKRFVEDPMNELEGKIDRHIATKLLIELPGILVWALEGWKRLRENDFQFTRSQKVDDYLLEYFMEQNPLLDFVKTCLVAMPSGRIAPKDLCQSVRSFLCANGLKNYALNLSSRNICREVETILKNERISFERKKSHGIRPFYDVALNAAGREYLQGSCEFPE
jgi:putative DNA primase/helicase